MTVVVEVGGERFELDPLSQFTFGRDPGVCTACLGLEPLDRGISRLAGSIGYEKGVWWIRNRSSSRTLHVIDADSGIGVPLPAAREGEFGGYHPVNRTRLTILVEGQVLTHALALSATTDDLPALGTLPRPIDPVHTTNVLPRPTDKQREALVAMVEGYLLPFPRYKPEPRTYEEAAARLGVPASTVRRRIEYLRQVLTNGGVGGLDTGDARRNLAEWILTNRIITSADLQWLEHRRCNGRLSER